KRSHTQLICDIGELVGLFVDTTSLEAFLQKIVEMVSEHMGSEVCSIYLFYDETEELVLKATRGLKPEAVGHVRMKLGEGLTGIAMKEMRPICERNASKAPGYRYFPEIGEEVYESFLAVPITRGQTRIGVLVIQNKRRDYFDVEDIQVVRAIASQLANTIEMAKVLIGLEEKREYKTPESPREELRRIPCRVGSAGMAVGRAIIGDERYSLRELKEAVKDKDYSLEDFRAALRRTESELEAMQRQIEEKLADVASLIFAAQILMLKDEAFVGAMTDLIRQEVSPPEAIMSVVEHYVQMFGKLSNDYLREKRQDVQDIGKRLLLHLVGDREGRQDHKGGIIIVQELYPSELLKLSSQGVQGVILLSGGITSHLSILARSLEIPLVITETPQLLRLPADTQIFLDAEEGFVHVNPAKSVLDLFDKIKTQKQKPGTRESPAALVRKTLTKTKDGARVQLLANVNLLSDLKHARAAAAQGVGLYRTEFPFIVRSDFPTEEEQYIVYKKVVDALDGQELTFRTLDIGGDKILSYYDYGKEQNPFLGMRSIRFSLKHKDIFIQQVRAILRAGASADLKIMFPMISSLDEFLDAKAVVLGCIKDLSREGVACHKNPKIGLMVELPSVLEIIDDLAQEADFFSVGTNDFVQYMLAVDRTNEKVAEFYLPHHPSILRSLKKVIAAADGHGKEVSICGDMAHDERYIFYLLGIGLRRFSLDSSYIPGIRAVIRDIDLGEAAEKTGRLLRCNKIEDIDRFFLEKGL
ncbi:MAG TPA: phosphoenolpyruvate--protein phosphotransferase, partial [Candidatus Omnitrophica bacterium]|nr:phosphoenolpyruvate--protein phosphotransferase [Candidatus Omnitrophota bacterium]